MFYVSVTQQINRLSFFINQVVITLQDDLTLWRIYFYVKAVEQAQKLLQNGTFKAKLAPNNLTVKSL